MLPKGLPYSARLHLKRDFERIIANGVKTRQEELVLWSKQTSQNRPPRFAVVVSKKLGPAVVRNRTKRLLREAFRACRIYLPLGVDIIVSPRNHERLHHVQAAQQALMSLCGKAALLVKLPSNRKHE